MSNKNLRKFRIYLTLLLHIRLFRNSIIQNPFQNLANDLHKRFLDLVLLFPADVGPGHIAVQTGPRSAAEAGRR